MADIYQWILDATAGAPLPFVFIILGISFLIVKAATVSSLANLSTCPWRRLKNESR